MNGVNDRLETWVREHPWSWAAVGSLVMGAIVLTLQLFVDRHPAGEAVPTCAATVAAWYLLLGFDARRRARRTPR